MTYFEQELHRLRRERAIHEELEARLRLAKQLMDDHYGEDIQLKQIATTAGLSLFHFIRSFRNYYGVTPYQYLRSVRVRQARQMLDQGMPVTDVCYSCGFSSVASFSSLFRRMTSHIPSRYTKRQGSAKSLPPLFHK